MHIHIMVYGPFHHGLVFPGLMIDQGMVTCAISKSSPAPWLPKRPKKQCFIGWGSTCHLHFKQCSEDTLLRFTAPVLQQHVVRVPLYIWFRFLEAPLAGEAFNEFDKKWSSWAGLSSIKNGMDYTTTDTTVPSGGSRKHIKHI